MGISNPSGRKSGPGQKFATSVGGGVSKASGSKSCSVSGPSFYKMEANGSARPQGGGSGGGRPKSGPMRERVRGGE